jgi:hypothetical protein
MGCGKSYLTDYIILDDSMTYIGIDKKDDLIEKIKKNKDNEYHLNYFVTIDNFPELYDQLIEDKINNDGNKLLFGLHSCGNLSTDSIRIFTENKCFNNLAIVGCCLNLLTEYVNDKVRNSDIFNFYMNNIGYDNKGNFLETTIKFEQPEKAGFPLSNYIANNYDIFLSRQVRNSSMQTFSKKDKIINSTNNIYLKKIYFRSLLQVFLEKHFPEMKNIYGFGKVDIKEEETFFNYVEKIFKNIDKIIKKSDSDVFKKCKDKYNKMDRIELENMINEFVKEFEEYEDILWAMYVIRPVFAKIIEIIIALDRVIYLKENSIQNVRLIKVFDENISVRNLLIYASK